jgi:hypothetical protein
MPSFRAATGLGVRDRRRCGGDWNQCRDEDAECDYLDRVENWSARNKPFLSASGGGRPGKDQMGLHFAAEAQIEALLTVAAVAEGATGQSDTEVYVRASRR